MANKADENKMRGIKKQAEEHSKVLEKIVEQLVAKYGRDLDEFIEQVKGWLDSKDALDDHEVESITIRVPVFMYFAVNGLENLGIQKDSAKAVKMEAFNNAVMALDGTIRDKQSYAENATLNEMLVEVAFDRAYRKLKTKVDVCDQLCQASRKVLSKRISELDINRMDNNRTARTQREYEDDRRTKFRERVSD